MRKALFAIIALFWVTVLVAQKPIIINGETKYTSNLRYSHIEKRWFNPATLEEETISTSISVSKDGKFHIHISNADNYYHRYWIYIGNYYTHTDLIAGDSLYLTFNDNLNYTGRGAGRNNYRTNVYDAFWNDIAMSFTKQKETKYFLAGLTSFTEKRLNLLNKYYLSGQIDSSYYRVEKTLIYNDNAEMLLSHFSLFENKENIPDSAYSQITSMLNRVNLIDEHYLQHSQFRSLVANLPHYVYDRNNFHFNTNLKREIEFADKHYTKLTKLYFEKMTIQEYISRANGKNEKAEILNIFEKQFNEPILRNVIQNQRNILNKANIESTLVIRFAIVLIFWFIAFVGVLFLLVKAIQYSTESKINLSLWLKIGFYMVVFTLTMVYVIQTKSHLINLLLVIYTLGYFLVHTYVLIPRYVLLKKGLHYALSLFIVLVVFLGFLLISLKIPISLYSVLHFTGLCFGLIVLSWMSHYIHLLASGKSTLKNLAKTGRLNPELAIHLVLLLLVNLMFIFNMRHRDYAMLSLIFYPIILLFYFHTFFTYPRLLGKGKVVWFICINVLVLLFLVAIQVGVEAMHRIGALKTLGIEPDLPDLISLSNIRLDLILVFALMLIPSFAYYFTKKQFIDLKSKGFGLYRKKEAELAQLRSQVNPHFLFNTLNTLYAFALKEGSEKTAECIAKLANLMRFMLDDMEKESILLQREISYIEDYIKLQSIRSAVEHNIEIIIDLEPENSYAIAPMLLIPFVENAFKHGMNPNKVSHLKIDISGKKNKMQFVIENSMDTNFEAYYKEKGFGIGIENVKSRLKYIYPNRHNISIAKTKDKFIVILSIDIL
jgi:hypothetical protein